MKKVIRNGLIGLAALNLFLLLSGIVIPWILSNDQLPLAGIVFLMTCILVAVVTFLIIIIYKIVSAIDDRKSSGISTKRKSSSKSALR